MDFDILLTFLTLARNGNFTLTAQEIYCTQANVSLRIKKLEDYYGCKLFERKAKYAKLTDYGEKLLPYVEEILKIIEKSKKEISTGKEEEISTIEVSSSNTPGIYILPNILYSFKGIYPEINVKNHIEYTSQVIENVLQEKNSFGIVSKPSMDKYDELLDSEVLCEDKLVLAVGKKHKFSRRKGIYLKELENDMFFVTNQKTSLITYLEENLGLKIKKKNLSVMGNIEAVKHMLGKGEGFSIISGFSVKRELGNNDIVEIPILDKASLKRNIYLIRKKGTKLNKTENMIVDYIRENLKKKEIQN